MNASTLLQLGQILLQLGPTFANLVSEITSVGSADATSLAALQAQVEQMDAKRLADWKAADTALDAAAQA